MLKRLKRHIRQSLVNMQFAFHRERTFSPPKHHDIGEVFVFIRSWERPLYLWACLDSLYRVTKRKCHFILIDNASTDPLVAQIIKGFERRGMFRAVHYMERNHGSNQQLVFAKYRKEMGKYFFLLDADITIESSEHCWTDIMIDTAENNPNLGLLGSYIDTRDFVGLREGRELEPDLEDKFVKNIIKYNSVERRIPPPTTPIIRPFKPPGRLLLARTEVIDEVGLPIGNMNLCQVVKAAGYEDGIATSVIHRHLSLLNIYDYPNYDLVQLGKYLSGK